MKKTSYLIAIVCCTFNLIHTAAGPQIVVNNNLKVIDYSGEVARQSKNTCGLHAAKNSIALYNFANGTFTHSQLIEALKRQVNSCPSGGSFSDNVYAQADRLGFSKNQISVLEQPGNLDFMPVQEAEKLANVADELLQQKNVYHAFALGKRGEHYIGAVLSRINGKKPIFYIADSLRNIDDPTNIKLITENLYPLLIQGPYYIRTNIINNLMKNAQNNMTHTPEAALQNIIEIIQYAQKYELLQNPRFINDYQTKLINILIAIEPALSNHDNALALYTMTYLNTDPTERGAWNPPEKTSPETSTEIPQQQAATRLQQERERQQRAQQEQQQQAAAIIQQERELQQRAQQEELQRQRSVTKKELNLEQASATSLEKILEMVNKENISLSDDLKIYLQTIAEQIGGSIKRKRTARTILEKTK
jgi:hypothetical protein